MNAKCHQHLVSPILGDVEEKCQDGGVADAAEDVEIKEEESRGIRRVQKARQPTAREVAEHDRLHLLIVVGVQHALLAVE